MDSQPVAAPPPLLTLVEKLIESIDALQSIMVGYFDYQHKHSRLGSVPENERAAWQIATADEYSRTYLQTDALFDAIKREGGVIIANPNSYRTLWDWANANSFPNPVCGNTRTDHWLRHSMYGPVVDPLKKAISQRKFLATTDSQFREILQGYFGQPGLFQFDRLHSKVVHRCRSLFESGNFDEAMLNAMKVVEDEVRTQSCAAPDAFGVTLISQAMKPDNAAIQLSDRPAEQEGAHHLYRGAIAFFRNPLSHRFLDANDPIQTFEVISLASLLMRLLDGAKKPAGS